MAGVLVPVSLRRRVPGRAAGALVLLAAGLAVLVAQGSAGRSVPLYDGVGFPDEPYRWVVPPAGSKPTPKVTEASTTVQVGPDGTVPNLVADSAEQGPQIQFVIEEGALRLAGRAGSVTATATAQAADPADRPTDGPLVSNVYRLAAGTDTGVAATPVPGARIGVTMRSSVQTKDAVVFVQRTTTGWQQVGTFQTGFDIYQAELPSLAPVALVVLPSGVQPTVSFEQGGSGAVADGSTGASVPGWVYPAAGGAAVVLIGGLLLVRRRMSG
jgi:hypothetical protein